MQCQRDHELEEEADGFHRNCDVGTKTPKRKKYYAYDPLRGDGGKEEHERESMLRAGILGDIDEIVRLQQAWLRYSAASIFKAR
jgi:hypothetical protein